MRVAAVCKAAQKEAKEIRKGETGASSLMIKIGQPLTFSLSLSCASVSAHSAFPHLISSPGLRCEGEECMFGLGETPSFGHTSQGYVADLVRDCLNFPATSGLPSLCY
jgi:hypothetical protein